MIAKFVPKTFVLFFALVFIGCETEPFETQVIEGPTSIVEEFESNFTLKSFDDFSGHIVDNIEIDWANYETKFFEGKEWYEFNVLQNQPIAYGDDGKIKGQFFSLLAHKHKEGYKFFINKMLSFSEGDDFTYFNMKDKYYHGMSYFYNMDGDVEYLFHYEKGILIRSVEDLKTAPNQMEQLGFFNKQSCHEKASAKPCSDLSCSQKGEYSSPCTGGGGCGGGSGGGSGWTQVFTHHYTDWYNNRGSYSEYSHTQYNGRSSEWVWVSGGSGSSSSSTQERTNYATTNSAGSTTYSTRKPSNAKYAPFKLTKDTSLKKHPCVGKIVGELAREDFTALKINNLGELSGGRHLVKGILDLFENSQEYDLTIKVAEVGYSNGAPKNATTVKTNRQNAWTITLDDDHVRNATQLAIARTLVHESVYAFLSYTLNVHRNSDLSNMMVAYYNNLGFQQHLTSGVKINLTEHGFIGQYVEGIAKSLSVWDNNSHYKEYYEYRAWGGLHTSSAFHALNSDKRQKIETILNNEQTGNSKAKGTKCL